MQARTVRDRGACGARGYTLQLQYLPAMRVFTPDRAACRLSTALRRRCNYDLHVQYGRCKTPFLQGLWREIVLRAPFTSRRRQRQCQLPRAGYDQVSHDFAFRWLTLGTEYFAIVAFKRLIYGRINWHSCKPSHIVSHFQSGRSHEDTRNRGSDVRGRFDRWVRERRIGVGQ